MLARLDAIPIQKAVIAKTMATPEIPNLNPPWQSMTSTVCRARAVDGHECGQSVTFGASSASLPLPSTAALQEIRFGEDDGRLNRVGAFQFGVEDGQPHNSYLNPIMFEELDKYEIKALPYSAQKHIRRR